MAVIYQKDRVYSLIVGTAERAIEINNTLNVRFRCVKSSDNKERQSEASIEVYNLSKETRLLFEEPYVNVKLSVGYKGDESLVTLFTGQVKNISSNKISPFLTSRAATDLVTKLDIEELYEEMNNTAIATTVPVGRTVREAILEIIRNVPEVTRHEMGGKNIERVLLDGASFSGTPRQALDKLSRDAGLEYTIDQGVLYISDRGGTYSDRTDSVPLIGQVSGLIERPEYVNEDNARFKRQARAVEEGTAPPKETTPKQNSLRIKTLLNPKLKAGGIFKLEFEELTGYYKIDSVEHSGEFRGNDWYSNIICTEKVG